MIPLRLSLRDFLSYEHVTLDFQGLHTACICGPNGSGKSSLLEAITWVLWGESRASAEDDLIHAGATEARVELLLQLQDNIYRVQRTRLRNRTTHLELQIARDPTQPTADLQFRSLSQKGLRLTQQRIIEVLKLDYLTFINSAYLRQGRADEFMLRRPNERKQILADLLQLGHYDDLAERARDKAREAKLQAQMLDQSLSQLQQQVSTTEPLLQRQQALSEELAVLQSAQQLDQEQQQRLQTQQQQHQWQEHQLQALERRLPPLQTERERTIQDSQLLQQQIAEMDRCLLQADEIRSGYQQWRTLQQQDDYLNSVYQASQALQQQYRQAEQLLEAEQRQLDRHRLEIETQQHTLHQQLDALKTALNQAENLLQPLEKLAAAQADLRHWEKAYAQVQPLLAQRQEVLRRIDETRSRRAAQLEELERHSQQLAQQLQDISLRSQEFEHLQRRVEHLQQRQQYQEQVREKGLERRSFLERLQAHQRDYEEQLAELEQRQNAFTAAGQVCPLCGQDLDPIHQHKVAEQYQAEHQALLELLWVVREQLSVSDREIQVLRQEYQDLQSELVGYADLLARWGQCQEQRLTLEVQQQQQQHLEQEQQQLRQDLEQAIPDHQLAAELSELDQAIAQLGYDERNHALARGSIEQWRWAEIKQAELRQAQQQQRRLLSQLVPLEQKLHTLLEAQTELRRSPLQRHLEVLQQQLAQQPYDAELHQQLRQELKQASVWQLHYQSLLQAEQQRPRLQEQLLYLQQRQIQQQEEFAQLEVQIEQCRQALSDRPSLEADLAELEQQIAERRQQLDRHLAEAGRLEQQCQQLQELEQQLLQKQQDRQQARYQVHLYQELAQAFGRNGIQTLLIEHILPQLEAETNQVLGRLTNSQLHVQFLTQRLSRNGAGDRPIETLEIRIGDHQSTRPYETYSGGEAFRINFAIRLAIARLLAQRSGSALQLLIIDEGFGTQDRDGCDRLIAAINAIASDFACILAITHLPYFREAFPTRIEVSKTEQGSQISLVG